MVMVLDFMQVHNFHGQTVNRVKILLFFELIIVLLCVFIIENKNILVFGEGPTRGLDDTTNLNILLILQDQGEDLC